MYVVGCGCDAVGVVGCGCDAVGCLFSLFEVHQYHLGHQIHRLIVAEAKLLIIIQVHAVSGLGSRVHAVSGSGLFKAVQRGVK